ncbi:MAG: SMC-Scp complex subunit ScpB [Spirochaetaceae bacterium]|jgi:segregation and condensation protein B|nr:SMC-Scp complex subunit ScpB [Spirochaetaceae bacterium]
MELEFASLAPALEAVFFMESEGRTIDALGRILEAPKEAVEEALGVLREKYEAGDSGLELVERAGGWLIRPRKDVWDRIKNHYGKKNEGRLSRAALETLSIIAYSQPITRAEIEAIRGVAADNMLRLLVERNVIKEVGKKDAPGRPVQYGTTKEFLSFFKLNSIAELPRLDEAEAERFRLAN